MADNTEAYPLSDLANIIPENSSGEITYPLSVFVCAFIYHQLKN
jgi:hypothetical protein